MLTSSDRQSLKYFVLLFFFSLLLYLPLSLHITYILHLSPNLQDAIIVLYSAQLRMKRFHVFPESPNLRVGPCVDQGRISGASKMLASNKIYLCQCNMLPKHPLEQHEPISSSSCCHQPFTRHGPLLLLDTSKL